MASLNDYKKHIQVLKMEQKIGRIQKELETVDYGDGCPFHGENDCAEVRKAYDRGYVKGLWEALTLFKVIEADTPQTEKNCFEKDECVKEYEELGLKELKELINADRKTEPQTETQIKTQNSNLPFEKCEYCEYRYARYVGVCDMCELIGDEPQTDCGWK